MSAQDDRARISLRARNGFTVELSPYGARVTAIYVPDGKGDRSVVYGFPRDEEYERDERFHGASIGRYANRIAGASFVIGDERFTVDANEGRNLLHGGSAGFDKQWWHVTERAEQAGVDGVTFALTSPHGDQGFPGTVHVYATFICGPNSTLRVRYRATTDLPTHLSMTNHSYFNLTPSGDAYAQTLELRASSYTPVDEALIPTGAIAPVDGTPFDFRAAREFGNDLDVNWVLDTGDNAIVLRDPQSQRALHISTTEPGVQVYSSFAGGIAIEPQHFPDTPNHPDFPSTLLLPNQHYESRITYEFT